MNDKPHIVLLPGLDGTGELFFALLPLLEDRFNVHVVRYADEGGFADYVASAAAQLPANAPLALVAESFSGPVAIALLAQQPARFTACVLSATFCKSPLPRLTGLAKYLPEALFASNPLSRFFLDLLVSGRDADPKLAQKAHELLAAVAPGTYRKRIEIVDGVDVTRELAAVDVPLLYIRAARDRIVLENSGAEILRHASNIRLVTVDGPHMILQTRAERCAELIAAHVLQGESRGGNLPASR